MPSFLCFIRARSSISFCLLLHLQAGHKYRFWLLWRTKEENLFKCHSQQWGMKKSELQQNHCGVFSVGQFLWPTAMVCNGLRLLPSRSCYLETKSRKFRHQGELPRVTWKKSEVNKWRAKSRKNGTLLWH